ncbi:hypothetical protein E1193_09365 [Micromonospora sp. KC606]|uniref:hypothetical protein n=1 Tax=Micromonospora sp. KC606 TaxID=2530379 RepID=UPI00104D3506|nr:hypothetical protein [Micromonospora sp. KC606]TDC83208.1 hypothetical protein E1193_09365 [Micromonospora sp. KC606]
METNTMAYLVGGPCDGSSREADHALLEVELNGMIHRYVRTTKQHGDDGTVYNYDGMVAPGGGEPGVENPAARVASPKADAEGQSGRA